MKFAAIDIGSNAVRLLLSRVIDSSAPHPLIKKESLVRMPLRLGEDAFVAGRISEEKVGRFLSIMTAFRHLIDAYQPISYMACATSAMREAANGEDIVARVRASANLDLQIINGDLEAEIILANHFEEQLNVKRTYLYIDVGGGSTELTLFSKRQKVASYSFKIGTVRSLAGLVPESSWLELETWVKEQTAKYKEIRAIGSGGNINKIFRLALCKDGKPLVLKKLRQVEEELNRYTLEERIRQLGLRPDRADVIIPACKIFVSVMTWAGIDSIYVPQIGLADGIVRVLYSRHINAINDTQSVEAGTWNDNL